MTADGGEIIVRVDLDSANAAGALYEASAIATMLEDEQPYNPLVVQLQDALSRARKGLAVA